MVSSSDKLYTGKRSSVYRKIDHWCVWLQCVVLPASNNHYATSSRATDTISASHLLKEPTGRQCTAKLNVKTSEYSSIFVGLLFNSHQSYILPSHRQYS